MPHSWEVEQKFEVDDVSRLLNTLHAAGFIEDGLERHSDIYFRHPSRDFRKSDEALRIRSSNDSACVTYKGVRTDAEVKTRPETELSIAPAEMHQWEQLLQLLGFQPLPAVRKIRKLFSYVGSNAGKVGSTATDLWEGMVVCFDDVEQLGTFVELEILVESVEALDQAQDRIRRAAAALGLWQVQSKSYLSQLLAKLGIEK